MKTVRILETKDFRQWDLFVQNHPHGSIYHLSGWKQALETGFTHIKGIFLVVWDYESNKITAGLPIYCVKSFITGNRLVSIPLAYQATPLVSNIDEMKMLSAELFDLFKHERASYIEIKSLVPLLECENLGYGLSNFFIHHYLLLDREPELLKKDFHKKSVQVPISRALKNGLQLKVGNNESELSIFFDIFLKSRKSLGLPVFPYAFFKTLLAVFGSSNNLTILLAMFEDEAVGAALLLKFQGTVTVEYGFDIRKYRKLFVNHFLDWESIKLAYNEGYKEITFGRTSSDNEGLLRYKQNWGTKSEKLPTYYFPERFCSIGAEKGASVKYNLTRTILKYSPIPVFSLLSNFIIKHIG